MMSAVSYHGRKVLRVSFRQPSIGFCISGQAHLFAQACNLFLNSQAIGFNRLSEYRRHLRPAAGLRSRRRALLGKFVAGHICVPFHFVSQEVLSRSSLSTCTVAAAALARNWKKRARFHTPKSQVMS